MLAAATSRTIQRFIPSLAFTDHKFQFCNLFETASASEWLMYISEWDAPGGGLPLSNIRVTTKVAVNALLGDSPDLVNYGSALMANLGDKEVKAVVCIFQFVIKSLLFSIYRYLLCNLLQQKQLSPVLE